MASYQPTIYKEQGGARMVVGSGGSLDIESGGEIDIESGGSLKIAGTDVSIGNASRLPVVAKVALAAATGNAGLLSWQNPESSAILVTRFVADITTQATGAANADFGSDGDGTGTSDDLLDGQDIGTAAVVLDNIDDQGTNGQSVIRLDANGGTTDYITGTASADPAGLVGNVYITYVVV
jgi:hypothetical protein